MGSVLLDSTVLIDTLRGRPKTTNRVLETRNRGDAVYACAINVEEIVRGLRPSEEERAGALFEGLRIVPLGRREGQRAGLWRRNFAERGQSLSQADCLIAAATLSIDGRLATGNPKDFPMAEIEVEHWPVNE